MKKKESTSIEVLLDEFAYSLAQTVNRTCVEADQSIFNARCDGLLIMIDEADNSSKELQLGSFTKLLLEKLQKHGCNRVIIGLAGLFDLRNKLHDSHPSSLRIFEDIPLERLSDQEVSRVIDLCFKEANAKNEEKTTIEEGARSLLIELSEGYPHFIQHFGYSTFAKDTDGLIDKKDVAQGAFGTNGALELIGNRYYRNAFYNKIQKESYRQVLRIMADKLDTWVAKSEIRKRFKGDDAILNNALKALRDRYIIFSKEGERGIYRLQHKGFALWIKLYDSRDLFTKANEISKSDKAS